MQVWRIGGGRELALGSRGLLMGILNVTPDSFSDGGMHDNVEGACTAARAMVAAGVDMIDVGGESTRPNAETVSGETERKRVIPIVARLAEQLDVPISIDTYRSDTAEAAIEAGATIVNDVTAGLLEERMLDVVARTGVGYIAMHNSRPDIRPDRRSDAIEDQLSFAGELTKRLGHANVAVDRVVFDPGIGFGKDATENLELLFRLGELQAVAFPVLLGTSRKRFLGTVTGREAIERDVATAATTVAGRFAGASIFRVHDVATNRDALRVADAIRDAGRVR